MISAAGILIVAKDGKALFLKRGPGGDMPGMWCIPGGRIEDGESAIDAAIRECLEECGYQADVGQLQYWTRRVSAEQTTGAPPTPPAGGPVVAVGPVVPSPGVVSPLPTLATLAGEQVDFTTYLCKGVEPFTPVLCDEHVAYAWAPIDQPPEPLHPGCRIALQRFGMDELQVAMAIRDGELTSPQRVVNVSLFNMRVTGTGVAYRKRLDEFVWRDPSLYLNDHFLARCNGLPVIMDHPEKATLDSKEYGERTVGSLLLPYIKPVEKEVWAIAKVFDDQAISMLADGDMSTSPAVVFKDLDQTSKMTLDDGATLLIEGKPSLLDHLAICQLGVWDKGKGPSGVDVTKELAIGDDAMPDGDLEGAKAGEKLDKILAGLDSMSKRMDSLEHTERKDKFRRKDGEDDGSYMDRLDAEEKGMAEELEKSGEPKEVAADKAKRARKDAEEEQGKADKARRDAEEEEKKKADAEAEEQAKKDAMTEQEKKDAEEAEKAKKDAEVTSASIKAAVADALSPVADRIAKVESMVKPMSDAEVTDRLAHQARADDVYRALGNTTGAPRPLDGEALLDYRRRLLTGIKKHSASWKDVDLAKVAADSTAFEVVEKQIYADAMASALHPTDLGEGELRPIVTQDTTGRRITSFAGKPRAWIQDFGGHRRRLSGIRNTSAR